MLEIALGWLPHCHGCLEIVVMFPRYVTTCSHERQFWLLQSYHAQYVRLMLVFASSSCYMTTCCFYCLWLNFLERSPLRECWPSRTVVMFVYLSSMFALFCLLYSESVPKILCLLPWNYNNVCFFETATIVGVWLSSMDFKLACLEIVVMFPRSIDY